jgi:type I restriction enzyme, R subunit
MKSEYFESPTIVLITDRTDLDDQLSAQFINAKILLATIPLKVLKAEPT